MWIERSSQMKWQERRTRDNTQNWASTLNKEGRPWTDITKGCFHF